MTTMTSQYQCSNFLETLNPYNSLHNHHHNLHSKDAIRLEIIVDCLNV
jgi:hypothetical protein